VPVVKDSVLRHRLVHKFITFFALF